MIEQFLRDPLTLSRMREGPLGEYLDLYATELSGQGYARRTVREQLWLIARFSWWLQSNDISLAEVSISDATKYLEQRNRRIRRGEFYSLQRILRILQEAGVIDTKPICECRTPIDELTDQFAHYLRHERGLAATTIRSYADCIRKFLSERFGGAEVEYSLLRPIDIVGFVKSQALHSKRILVMTNALRAFFRYAHYQGFININLAAIVPPVANWQMTTVPKALPSHQVEQVIASCDRQTATGRRNYAILLLLARLGLRAGEIASLTINDIDWQTGCITVHGKGDHLSQLPLPPDAGEALAAYLQNGRPQTANRYVFLRGKAPVVNFTSQRAIGNVVRRALIRAGIDVPRKGAHQFRHALATQMLQRGASLPEISQVLRHRSAQATEIYTKVDLVSLRALAMPWPGGVR